MPSMAGYTKLFNSILASTIWRAPDKTRIVWITLLAMADKNGIAEGSVPGLADFARVSIPACRKALAELMAPDNDSRSQEYDGRRIEATDGGWRILNHRKYRERLNTDERREYFRLKKREQRSKSTFVQNVQDKSTLSTQAEASPSTDPKNVRTRATSWTPETFMDAYRERWKGIYGHECSLLLKPLEFSTLAEQMGRIPEETLRAALGAFFESSDPFVAKSKHPLGLFLREPTKYLAQVKPAVDDEAMLAGVRAEIERQNRAVKG